jgi:hypothetical protein
MQALKLGTATSQDAERFVSDHRKLFDAKRCENTSCRYGFVVSNKWLASLRLEPPAEFFAEIIVENGTLTQFDANLVRSMDIYPSFQGSAGMAFKYAELPEYYARFGHYGFPTPVGKPYLKVIFDNHANAEQQQHALGFSFHCLTKPGGGCDVPCDYLPMAWRDWKVDLSRNGFPAFDLEQTYPKSQHCK